MPLVTITAPSTEPVSRAEAKAHLRVETTDEDTLIDALISAARDRCEQELDRSVAAQTLELRAPAFPVGAIDLPRGPVSSVTSVKYVDAAGTLQTLSSAGYALEQTQVGSRLVLAYGESWPATRTQDDAVLVRYVAGFSTCPAAIRQWMLLAVGSMYAMREADADRVALPQDFAARLLDRYRVAGL